MHPDIILLATGNSPAVPPIHGVKQKNVVIAEDLLMNRAQVGKRVAIVGGGGTGCETAEYLAARGHQVSIPRGAVAHRLEYRGHHTPLDVLRTPSGRCGDDDEVQSAPNRT